MEVPELTEHHRKLDMLVGHWTGTETMHPSQWDPKGGAAQGCNDVRKGLAGFALVTDYKQERDGVVTYEGHGVTTYDPSEKCYTLHWFDSMGPGMHARATYDFKKKGVWRARMEMSPDGKKWDTLFECDYVKE